MMSHPKAEITHAVRLLSGTIAAAVIVTAAATACSTTTSRTGTSPTTATTSNSGSSSSPSGSATAGVPFVGHWHTHGANLHITATTATINATSGMGPCMRNPQLSCSQTYTLGVVSSNDKQLTLTVTAVSFHLRTGQTTTVNPNPDPATAVGDSMQLVWQAPGLLKATLLHGFPDWQGGNPYWCGEGINESNKTRCGA